MKKRVLSIIMCLVLMVTMCACGESEAKNESASEEVKTENPALEFERKCYETVDYAFANFQAYLDKWYTGTTFEVVEVLVYNWADLENEYPYVKGRVIVHEPADELKIDKSEGEGAYFEYRPDFDESIYYQLGYGAVSVYLEDRDSIVSENKESDKKMIEPGLYVAGKADVGSVELSDTFAFILDMDDYNSYRTSK